MSGSRRRRHRGAHEPIPTAVGQECLVHEQELTRERDGVASEAEVAKPTVLRLFRGQGRPLCSRLRRGLRARPRVGTGGACVGKDEEARRIIDETDARYLDLLVGELRYSAKNGALDLGKLGVHATDLARLLMQAGHGVGYLAQTADEHRANLAQLTSLILHRRP